MKKLFAFAFAAMMLAGCVKSPLVGGIYTDVKDGLAVTGNAGSSKVGTAEAYHTFPVTLFENREAGDLTFDITYKEHRGGRATINFTCRMAQAVPADSVRFAADAAVMSGPVDKLYLEPEKKQWKHRYTFDADGSELCGFFDERALPEVTVYVGGKPYVYRAKRSAWRSYAPIGYRIFDMIRVNEQ